MNGHEVPEAQLVLTGEIMNLVYRDRALGRAILSLLRGPAGSACSAAVADESAGSFCFERLAEAGLVALREPGAWELTETGRQVAKYLSQYQADEALKLMHSQLECTAESVFLDLGCGAGAALVAACELPVPPRLVIGIDIDRASLLAARALLSEHQPRCLLVQADLAALPIKAEMVTQVCSRLSLPYVDQRAALSELGRVVASNGKVFLQLHSVQFYLRLLWNELSQWKRVVINGFCLLNGLMFSLFEVQLKISRRSGVYQELYQTSHGISRILRRQGIAILWAESSRIFRVLGKKQRS